MAQDLLESQGFGSGAAIATSGELLLFGLLSDRKKPTLFDVGAHIGDYSEAFLERFPGGRTYAFEPSADHFRVLSQRLGGRANARCFEIALGTASSEAVLYKDAAISGLASLTRRRLDHFGIQMTVEERIQVGTLDAVCKAENVEYIDLLKIDVEGHELAVLKGAIKALERHAVGAVQFEFGGCNLDTRTSLQDVYYFFALYGYRLHIVQPSGRLRALPRYSELYEQYRTTNYVALPPQEWPA